MREKQIWIFVRGGLVQQVKSTDHDVKVHLIDYDNLAVEDDEEERKETQKQELLSEGMFIVF